MVKKTQLVLYAHGSTDPRWRAPFERLAGSLGDRARLAYLEFCPPTLDDVAEAAVAEGIGRLVVLPLFLAAGVHVTRDLEGRAAGIRSRHPELEVELLPPVGEHPRLAEALREIVAEELRRLS